jgi:hypothetical protein
MRAGCVTGVVAAAFALLTGCASTGWRDLDWRGRSVRSLEQRLGLPTRVLDVSPGLSLRFWAAPEHAFDAAEYGLVDPESGSPYRAVFLVRGDGTVVGAPLDCRCGSPAAIAGVTAVLGPPTREVRTKTGNALLTWEAHPGGASHRLTLGVDPAGFVEFWN